MFLPVKVMLEKRFYPLVVIPAGLVAVGTIGYRWIEDWSLLDSLYMTVITLTTVGFREMGEMTPAGKFFTMFLCLGGIFTLFYSATEIIRAVVSGEIRTMVRRQRMERELAEMRDHLIVCGFGRMGRLVCRQFAEQSLPFVVIEKADEFRDQFDLPHGVALAGDATRDEVLRRAGVERARALVSVLGEDADNLYITMSARLLNPNLFIIARSEEQHCEIKLTRAGANRVVSPYQVGGAHMAQAILRPNVVDFIELATKTQHLELQIEETRIGETSPLIGATLKDGPIRRELGLIIVAIKKPAGNMLFNPPPETALEFGDILIALGDRPHLDQLDRIASGQNSPK